MLYYLVPSTVSFSTREAKLAFFSGFFREECEREPGMEVRVLPLCPFFSVHIALFIVRGKALSLLRLSTRRIFPDAGVQFLRKRALLSVSFVSKGVIDSSMLERDDELNYVRVRRS